MQHLPEAGTSVGGKDKSLCEANYEGSRVLAPEQDRSL
jgi:hypothetical protein